MYDFGSIVEANYTHCVPRTCFMQGGPGQSSASL